MLLTLRPNSERAEVVRAAVGSALICAPLQIDTRREYLGTDVTNNEAEYQALIMGLNMALEHDVDRLEICGDSEVVIRQVNSPRSTLKDQLDCNKC
jgi:ribonuclease HI